MWAVGSKASLSKMDIMCFDKKKGSLWIKSLSILNKAHLSKWNWRFANGKGVFWNQVIEGKYGEEDGGWCFREVKEVYRFRVM